MIPTILESSLFIHFAISDFPQWNRRLRWWIAIITSGSKVWETTWLPSSLPNLWTGRFKRWGAVGVRFWNYRWGFQFCWGHIEWGHGTREDTWFWNSTISDIKSKMKMKIVEFQKTTKTHQIRTSRWKSCPENSSRLYQQPRRMGLRSINQDSERSTMVQAVCPSGETIYESGISITRQVFSLPLKVWIWECLLWSTEIGHEIVWLPAGKMTDLVWVYD